MSAPSTPVLDGFAVSWDPLNKEWVAISRFRHYRLSGRSQSELNAKRWQLYAQVLSQCLAAIDEVFPCPKNDLISEPGS